MDTDNLIALRNFVQYVKTISLNLNNVNSIRKSCKNSKED